jgi:hypothetical protein
MTKPSPRIQLVLGGLLLLFALLGITNSVHGAARVVYATLIIVSISWLIYAERRRRSNPRH